VTTPQLPKNRRATIALALAAAAAGIWALADYASYSGIVNASLWSAPWLNRGDGVSARFIVSELFMVPLFGIVMRDLWQSSQEGGTYDTVRKAAMPLVAAVAAVVVPIVLSFGLRDGFGRPVELASSYALMLPAGVVYAWLFARIGPGRRHPAGTFLVALALLADLISMLIVAAFHAPEMQGMWLGLVILAMAFCEGFRRFNVHSFWPYMLIGAPLSWFGFLNAGLHAGFALVPLIPFMGGPHAPREDGVDTLASFERYLAPLVDFGVFAFVLVNVGLVLTPSALATPGLLIDLCSLVIGTGGGALLLIAIARALGLELAKPLTVARCGALGLLAGLAFALASWVSALS